MIRQPSNVNLVIVSYRKHRYKAFFRLFAFSTQPDKIWNQLLHHDTVRFDILRVHCVRVLKG